MALPGQIDLNDLVVFAAVVEAGGFAKAAARLGVAPAKVSVEVARLETRLGATLFTRTTRRVVPTEAGQALHDACAPLLLQLRAAVDNVHASTAVLTGSLRITAPADFAAQSLAPALARFAALHPALALDLRAGDAIADLVAEGIDVAIRMGWLRDSSLRAVKLGSFDQYLVAAPAYLERVAPPHAPEDLPALDWLALTRLPTPLKWTLTSTSGATRTVHLRSRIRTDSAGALRALVREGVGITVLDQYSAEPDLRAGTLVRLLPDWSLPAGGTYAVFPPGRHVSRKAHAFVAFYQTWLHR
ncbi:DNA-binding transcriptional LysR family regulator [Pseudoduganella flava]|uniref:DNA-binding transcriptional LysR family regulator n=1 Tax=Pseudoduganella flava TaxID=871742 RepID=A0A562PT57_9BURK|nr:LysR family transcriptional regulator [Pseudoduganella flava]QGZ39135.1 LysR family transcriptional regulator [Pseudoduganella flava]TWI47578.1 DNA-binding transcriptional LysR family regulator [Pseudoduganella flava]